jgi:hypothetical protein
MTRQHAIYSDPATVGKQAGYRSQTPTRYAIQNAIQKQNTTGDDRPSRPRNDNSAEACVLNQDLKILLKVSSNAASRPVSFIVP